MIKLYSKSISVGDIKLKCVITSKMVSDLKLICGDDIASEELYRIKMEFRRIKIEQILNKLNEHRTINIIN